MADGYIQTPPEGAGKRTDADELTVNGVTVERLRVAVPDTVKVRSDLLELILQETTITNNLLAQAFGLGEDIDVLRNT